MPTAVLPDSGPREDAASYVARRERLSFVDGLRGLAALWVVLFHASASGFIDKFKDVLPQPVARLLFDFGYLGVTVFFVVSGFVMMHSVRRLPFTPEFGRRFMLRRLLRLTPPYYVSIAFVVAYGVLKATTLAQPVVLPSLASLGAHVLYLQDILLMPPISVVYWTLCIEIQFYLVFVAFMLARHWLALRLGLERSAVLLLVAAALVGLPWGLGIVRSPLYAGGFLTFWYCFVLGMLLSAQAQSRWARLALLGYVAMLGAATAAAASGFTVAALAATALIYAGLRLPSVRRVLDVRPLQFLGLVSYSLYLIHNQVAGATAFAIRRLGPFSTAGEFLLLIAMVAMCLLAAYVSYRWVEKPSIELSRKVALNPSPLTSPASIPSA